MNFTKFSKLEVPYFIVSNLSCDYSAMLLKLATKGNRSPIIFFLELKSRLMILNKSISNIINSSTKIMLCWESADTYLKSRGSNLTASVKSSIAAV